MGIPMKRPMASRLVDTLLMLPAAFAVSPQDQDTMTLYLNRDCYKSPDIQ